jgi:hypothetical protein
VTIEEQLELAEAEEASKAAEAEQDRRKHRDALKRQLAHVAWARANGRPEPEFDAAKLAKLARVSLADVRALLEELADVAGALLGSGEADLVERAELAAKESKAASEAAAEWQAKLEELKAVGHGLASKDSAAYEAWRRLVEAVERRQESNRQTVARFIVGDLKGDNPLLGYRWPAAWGE